MSAGKTEMHKHETVRLRILFKSSYVYRGNANCLKNTVGYNETRGTSTISGWFSWSDRGRCKRLNLLHRDSWTEKFRSAAGGQDFLGEKLNIRGIISLAAVEGTVSIM